MVNTDISDGPILRLFEARAKVGRADELLKKFAATSAKVVQGEPGNVGYFLGCNIVDADDLCVFASLWSDLAAIKARFGQEWQRSFLPPGYDDLIDECRVRHFDVSSGWHVPVQERPQTTPDA